LSLGYIGHKKCGVTASPAVIKRVEKQARGVPKTLAFNLLNSLVDMKTQAESNISGQNGKKALDKNIIDAIQCKVATLIILLNEVKQFHCLEINCLSLLVDVIPNLTLFGFSWTVWFGKWSDIRIIKTS